ncbi:MAG: deoxyribodipyrimidine photo-lyase [Cypionkella sp.]|nr:deoxyribodipyrimidine photo-lyase [Cypionkella sp.]
MNVLIWFKRDLRIHDHAALVLAADMARDMGGGVLPLYIAEPDLWAQPDASARQWEAVAEALGELRADLAALGAPLILRTGGAVEVISRLCQRARATHIVSHMETGTGPSYARDRAVAAWARGAGISWREVAGSGVRARACAGGRAGQARAMPSCRGRMLTPAPAALRAVDGVEAGQIPTARALRLGDDPCAHRQNGGRSAGLAALESFLALRGAGYASGISSPLTAERSCARISPHLAVGSLSLREVSHAVTARRAQARGPWARSLAAFDSRLAWRDHFIQKLEDQPDLDAGCDATRIR